MSWSLTSSFTLPLAQYRPTPMYFEYFRALFTSLSGLA